MSDLEEKVLNLLEPDPFEEWLGEHQPTGIVGYARLEGRCPLANYLRERTGLETRVEPSFARLSWSEDGRSNSLVVDLDPLWEAFVFQVDRYAMLPNKGVAVTVDEVREALAAAHEDLLSDDEDEGDEDE